MEETCPESRIIEVVDGKWNGSWISKAMLLGPAFEWGEEIEVRDFEDSPWIVNKFFAYTRCLISPFTVHGQYFILMMGFFLMLLRVIFLLPVTTAIHLVTGRLWCGTSIIRNG